MEGQSREFSDKNKNCKRNDLSGDTLWLRDMNKDKSNGEENRCRNVDMEKKAEGLLY